MAYNTHFHKRAQAERRQASWSTVPEKVFAQLGVTSQELSAVDQQMLGHLVLPGMPAYEQARMGRGMSPFDEGSPLIVFQCQDLHDVWVALQAIRRYDWPFIARSGGHSTAGFSSDCQTIIDLSGLDDISLAGNDRVSAGPGCTFGKLNRFMKAHKLHIPTGNCDDVRCGGYVQGGGYGYTSRQYGMQCDSVVEATLMLADGRTVKASADVNPDLFWAIRGGTGNNFGILVNLVYQAVPLGEVWGFVLTWGANTAAAAMKRAQDTYTPDQGLEIGYTGNITTIENNGTHEPVYMFSGICVQGREVGMKAIQPMLDLGQHTWLLDQTGYYFDINDAVEGKLPGPPPMSKMHEIKSSGYLARPMSLQGWRELFDYFSDNVAKTNPYNLIVLEAYGGAINAVPALGTAFVHRDVLMDIYIDAFWREGEGLGTFDQAQNWMEGINALLAPHLNGHWYQNYPQRGMVDFRWQYWGDAFNGLLFVKNKFDPGNCFHYEQSISPYPDDPRVRRSDVPSPWSDKAITYSDLTPAFDAQPG